jgi:2-hydroxymuconate-semialdehyde hydrolase
VLLIHGSGPGVSAWANWRLVMPALARQRRVIAPDMVGFGYSDRPAGIAYSMDTWVQQALDLIDALDLPRWTWWATASAARWRWPWPSAPRSGCAAWC